MTPLEALNLLCEWKKMSNQKERKPPVSREEKTQFDLFS
jgi:hypothetical protein